ncbi:HutD family protein [Streptococcus didelphis]|uniref:HutD family protein n=1 Tax=Streptococcus didelphis TaxID=102886 RepID=A0ABY9LJT0_9STRE|nr:HutD family protein [Streptococcus didelphis]WMB28440.1 HutD family protein [Streptococcus didelphis]WMB29115.1 HutD family protein [Streptococcus didelphis]
MPDLSINHFKDFKELSWSGGKTRELYLFPPSGNYAKREFDFRLSQSSVTLPTSVFSQLEGYHRLLMPLDRSLILINKTRQSRKHLQVFETYYFWGGDNIVSQGQCFDLNLMYNNKYKGQLFAISQADNSIYQNSPIQMLYALTDLSYEINDGDRGYLEKDHLLVINQNSQVDTVKIVLHSRKETSDMIAVWAGLSARRQCSLSD